jgi:hypothetical protein
MRTFFEETPPAPSGPVTTPEPVVGRSQYDPIGAQAPQSPGPLNLSDAERQQLADAAASDDPGRALKAVWQKVHQARAGVKPADFTQQPADRAQQPADPGQKADVALEVNDALLTDTVLRERSGGAASLALIEPIMDLGNAFSARIDRAWQQGGEEAFGKAIEAGLCEIREREFGGNTAAMNEAFSQIDKAAAILDPSGALAKALNESGALSDPAIFRRAHLLAASVLRKRHERA